MHRGWAIALILISLTVALASALPALPNEETNSQLTSYYSSGVLMAARLTLQPSGVQVLASSETNFQVTTSTLPQNEPSIALNPHNPQNLVAGANDVSGGLAWLGSYSSFDGGNTWTGRLIQRVGVLGTFQATSDPAVAFDRNGNLYYAGIAFNIQGSTPVAGTVFVAKSSDGGLSFSNWALVAVGSRIFNDKPYISVDNSGGAFDGRVYVSWTRFSSSHGDIMISNSTDGGATFSAPVRVSVSLVNQGSLPAVGPAGELYVVWNDLSNRQIMVAKSTDGGVSFSSPIRVSNYAPLPTHFPNSLFRLNSNPAAAVDDVRGNVYVAWADYGRRNADILFSRSADGGATWGSPVRVNDDSTPNDQFFPWMSVSAGQLSIVFYDRRLDPDNHLMDLFYAESVDGGSLFSANVRVTDASSNPDAFLVNSNESFIGDYIGIASNQTFAHPVWTDMRNVTPSSPENEDIFTSSLPLNRPPVLDPVGPKTVDEGVELTFTTRASDPDANETLTLAAEELPAGASFTSTPLTIGPVTGNFSWTPSEEQGPGTYSVRIIAFDGSSASSENVTITVNEVNSPPQILAPNAETVEEGSLLTFIVKTSDPDIPPDNVTLSASDLPAGATFDPATGNLSWTPVETQVGNYTVTFTATDNGQPPRSSRKQVTLHVLPVNDPPTIILPGPMTVDEQSLVSFQAAATDPDRPAETFTFILAPGAPSGATMTENGIFNWVPSESQGPENYTITVIVSDGSLTDLGAVPITVREVDRPPILVVPGSQTVEVGSPLLFSVSASDPDTDTAGQPLDGLTLSVRDLPSGASFEPDTGAFAWTPGPGQAGVYSVKFTVREDNTVGFSETRTVTITVRESRRPAVPFLGLGWSALYSWITLGLLVLVFSILTFRSWMRKRHP